MVTTAIAEQTLRRPNGQLLPGQALNPGGVRATPAGSYNLQDLLRTEAEKRPEIVEKILGQAADGHFASQEMVFDRLYGKAVQMSVTVNIAGSWQAASGLVAALPDTALLAPAPYNPAAQLQAMPAPTTATTGPLTHTPTPSLKTPRRRAAPPTPPPQPNKRKGRKPREYGDPG